MSMYRTTISHAMKVRLTDLLVSYHSRCDVTVQYFVLCKVLVFDQEVIDW